MKIINPATASVIKELKEDSATAIKEQYHLLVEGQKKWKLVPLDKRLNCIRKFSDLLDQNKQKLAEILTSEMGKPLSQSYNEIKGARNRIQFFLDNSSKWLCEEWISSEGAVKEKICYEPLGVVANISAWNYPYLVGVNVFIPALIAGNAVLYKPSEYTTLTGFEIEQLLYESGIPTDCFKTITGGKDAGETLLELPLNGYFFTGSFKTGQYIAQKVASKLVPCQLELGGKDPLYVMNDIESIEKTAAATADGAFYNNGQSCCAVERIYVHEDIYNSYIKAFQEEVAKFKVGDPTKEGVYIGPLARKEQLDFLAFQVKDAVDKGARILSGGKKMTGDGYYFEPTVLIDVNHDMSVMKEESFGPVIGIQKVKDDTEALQLMMDTTYGLTAAVYSKSKERADAIIEKINTGTVYWNCCDRVSASLPWSGRKCSGLGSTLSYQGIRAFVQPKAYHLTSP